MTTASSPPVAGRDPALSSALKKSLSKTDKAIIGLVSLFFLGGIASVIALGIGQGDANLGFKIIGRHIANNAVYYTTISSGIVFSLIILYTYKYLKRKHAERELLKINEALLEITRKAENINKRIITLEKSLDNLETWVVDDPKIIADQGLEDLGLEIGEFTLIKLDDERSMCIIKEAENQFCGKTDIPYSQRKKCFDLYSNLGFKYKSTVPMVS